jgi:acetyl-CoA acetyltransferase
MSKKVYIAAYHQSKFGKLMGMTVPAILQNAVEGACREIRIEPSAIDVGSVGATCNLPLKTFDCSQISDGYAALILATEEGLHRLGVARKDCVEVAGYAQATDPLRKEGRDILRPAGACRAMSRAYAMAAVGPADINVAEVHDCFTVMGAIATEVMGKAEYGQGARYWVDGKARPDGECGINTSGGLIAKGHPIGATGIAMVGWCAWQLLGKAPQPLQVPNPRVAATFNIGGPICATVCTVLKHAE